MHAGGDRSGEPLFDGVPDFDARLLPELRAIPFFRLAPQAEIDRAFDPYRRGDIGGLLAAWDEGADPIRAQLDGARGWMYRRSADLPSIAMGLSFLFAVRGALRAGERFRDRLRPDVRAAITTGFPWLERRHLHVPDGWAPALDFPDAYRDFLESGSLDDARARWALTTALNEVQQQAASRHLGRLVRLPALERHGALERALAERYLACWSPRATPALFRQAILVLDGLNAAVFDGLLRVHAGAVAVHTLAGMVAGRAGWRAFVAGLERAGEADG